MSNFISTVCTWVFFPNMPVGGSRGEHVSFGGCKGCILL